MKIKSDLAANLFLFCLVCTPGMAQNSQSKINSPLVGTWTGTSICQIKSSPCNDENVVYHISRTKDSTVYNIQANKIVNGIEEDMGLLTFTYNVLTHQLNSTAFGGKWTFTLAEDKLDGTLIHKNELYRVIHLSKKD